MLGIGLRAGPVPEIDLSATSILEFLGVQAYATQRDIPRIINAPATARAVMLVDEPIERASPARTDGLDSIEYVFVNAMSPLARGNALPPRFTTPSPSSIDPEWPDWVLP